MKDHRMTETVPVRVTKMRYKQLRRIAKANGHTISWLLNYALDLYFQEFAKDVQAASPAMDLVRSAAEPEKGVKP
jgi:hypothetical protein